MADKTLTESSVALHEDENALDINTLLNAFAAENAQLTSRAVMAEQRENRLREVNKALRNELRMVYERLEESRREIPQAPPEKANTAADEPASVRGKKAAKAAVERRQGSVER